MEAFLNFRTVPRSSVMPTYTGMCLISSENHTLCQTDQTITSDSDWISACDLKGVISSQHIVF